MRLHNLALAGAFVVDAAEMQHAVNYHPHQFVVIRSAYSLGIRGHSVKRDKHISPYKPAGRIVKRYDIRVVVMLEILPVDF